MTTEADQLCIQPVATGVHRCAQELVIVCCRMGHSGAHEVLTQTESLWNGPAVLTQKAVAITMHFKTAASCQC